MNKKFSKIFAVALALIMCMALAVPTFAAGTPASPGASSSITVSKNLILNSDASVPAAEFKFTLNAYESGSDYPLYNGIMAGVKVNDDDYTAGEDITVSFADNDDTTNGLPTDANSDNTTAGKKYATQSFDIDFSGVDFKNAGVYRYVIKEKDVDPPYSITSSQTQYIDVYVQYAPLAGGGNEETLSIQGIFMHTNEELTPDVNNPTGSKSAGFDNAYTTYNLTVEKYVSGNQASKQEYFDFTVKVTECPVADTYTVNVTGTENNAEEAKLVVSDGTGTATFKLKNGQGVIIQGLPVGTKYTVSEATSSYTATYAVIEGGEVKLTNISGNEYANDAGITGDTTVTFTNTREGTVPTGILLTIVPFAALMLLGAAGIVVIFRKKSKAM